MRLSKQSQTRPRRRAAGRAKLWPGAGLVAVGALCAGLLATAGPAYADVTSNAYTIGSPTGALSSVVVSPTAVTVSSPSDFEISFTTGTALAGGAGDWVDIVPSTALGSTPANIAFVGGTCVQAGTDGGAFSATGIMVELTDVCTLTSGAIAQVDFQATTPASTGTLTFAVTTSRNGTAAISNPVTIGTSNALLSATSYQPGSNAVYTISDASVADLSANGTEITLTAETTEGSGAISFHNAGAGGPGYSVTYMAAGGSATADPITDVSAAGASVTITLQTALSDNDSFTVTATGTNPTSAGTANDIVVEAGNGTAQTTSVVNFGGSVSGVSVAASNPVAGGYATYTVTFRASDAAFAGGDIYLTEAAGPTNFAAVTGVEVVDTTQNWQFVTASAARADGSISVPLSNNINAGDTVEVVIADVINPAAARTISDFTVATTGDPVAVTAPPYTISANASAGVVVTVNPATTGALATYTIANLHAQGVLTGGTATVQLVAPSGTVFPDNPGSFAIADSTTAAGSGIVTAPLSGGGTSSVTFTVPNTIAYGDSFSITVTDVVNPSTASSGDTIQIVNGNITGPIAVPATTTSVPATTTTTKPAVKPPTPVIADLSKTRATVSKTGALSVKLRCSAASCKGTVTLADVTTKVSAAKYSLKAGKTGSVALKLNAKGLQFIKGAKDHTIHVHVTVTVTGGRTVKVKTALAGS